MSVLLFFALNVPARGSSSWPIELRAEKHINLSIAQCDPLALLSQRSLVRIGEFCETTGSEHVQLKINLIFQNLNSSYNFCFSQKEHN